MPTYKCCGGQRTAMWRHLYDLDDAHDYELKYCEERAYSCSEDTSKLTRARVYATTERVGTTCGSIWVGE
ncbi:hypothetical protein NFJ02_31g79980 [Pycnococcus provasolii]